MARRITDNPRDAIRRTAAIDARGRRQLGWSLLAHARVVIIKHEDPGVVCVTRTAHPQVARTQITITHVSGRAALRTAQLLGAPGSVLAMRSHHYPFAAQRMPALFPGHAPLLPRALMLEQPAHLE